MKTVRDFCKENGVTTLVIIAKKPRAIDGRTFKGDLDALLERFGDSEVIKHSTISDFGKETTYITIRDNEPKKYNNKSGSKIDGEYFDTDTSSDNIARNFIKYSEKVFADDRWCGIPNTDAIRNTEKATYIRTMVFDSLEGKGAFAFCCWCPTRFLRTLKDGSLTVPAWFLEEKIKEYFNIK